MLVNTAVQGITDAGITSIAVALTMLPGIGVALGQGKIAAEAVAGVARQPEASGKILQTMIIGQGITETAAIYGLVIGFVLIFFS